MYECKACDWFMSDEDVDENFPEITEELLCPTCDSETEWFDGTEEDILW